MKPHILFCSASTRVNQFPFGLKTNTIAEGIYFVMLLNDDATLSKSKLIISR
ncbi:MAG TPA: hypothetical protein VE978_25480 [Chitinophagales bacterium]|nr:hypothetical protein [Chitinophagales bacterium]